MFVLVMGIHMTSNLSNGRELVAPFLFNFSTMTMEKYYTPTIEEFHVGFEFEDKHSDYSEDEKNWIGRLYVLRAEYELDTVQDRIDDNRIRVKHLDREDIESLGWEANESDQYYKGSERIDVNPNISTLIVIKSSYKYERKGVSYVGHNTLFDGTIKNKSELKKLLKQLGI
jgi:hypothetical protein